MIFEMRGESGETYQFGGTLQPGAKPEDMLTHIAGEIASTRRKRPAPKYKVKSVMPKAKRTKQDFTTVEVNGVKYSR
jgi:hypothetical protein